MVPEGSYLAAREQVVAHVCIDGFLQKGDERPAQANDRSGETVALISSVSYPGG